MFAPKWYWFLISLLAALCAAVLYLMSTPAVYTRTAAILVKDDSKKGPSGGAAGGFPEFDIFKSNTNINNELLALKSPTLMAEVVRRLGLNETYTVRRGLKDTDLYKSSPVAVSWLQGAEGTVGFVIERPSEGRFRITDFTVDGEETGREYTGRMGDAVRTPAGTLTVHSGPEAGGSLAGIPVRYVRMPVDAVTDGYTGRLRVSLDNEDATIVSLSIDDASTEKAEDILNTLIRVYNEKWIQDKNRIAVSTSRFIGDRLGVIESELGHVDESISSYKSAHLLPDVQAASSLYMSQAAENRKELQSLLTQQAIARHIRKELDGKDFGQPLPSNSGIDNDNVEGQIADYNKLVLDRNRIVSNSSGNSPAVRELTSSLESMRQTIVRSVDNLLVSLETRLQSLRREEAANTGRLASNPNQAKYLLSVERQQKVKEELYLYLLQKREENELSQAFTAYNTRVITAPRGSMSPTAPRRTNILLAAFALGLLVPAAAIFAKESLNTRIRGRKDLEGLTAPLAGEIPQYGPSRPGRPRAFVVKEGRRDIVNEAFRVLRSNLDFMSGAESGRNVFVITSFNPGSGKSFIAMNTAMSFAIRNRRTLLVDGDLRHGSVSSHVSASGCPGLSDYLGGRTDAWEELIVRCEENGNLHVLPAGTVPPNPTELLESGRLAGLIAALRGEYDHIFIDCPPVDIVADTQIIGKLADRTLFVVRAGLLDRSMLPELESIYAEKRFRNLCVILNGTESRGGRYSYRYGYRQGYHYAYATYYGNDKD